MQSYVFSWLYATQICKKVRIAIAFNLFYDRKLSSGAELFVWIRKKQYLCTRYGVFRGNNILYNLAFAIYSRISQSLVAEGFHSQNKEQMPAYRGHLIHLWMRVRPNTRDVDELECPRFWVFGRIIFPYKYLRIEEFFYARKNQKPSPEGKMLHVRIVSCGNAGCTSCVQVFVERWTCIIDAIRIKYALLFTSMFSNSCYP